jgi:hypothetical protein
MNLDAIRDIDYWGYEVWITELNMS